MDAVLFELEERRRQADARRHVRAHLQGRMRGTGRLRWALQVTTACFEGLDPKGDQAGQHVQVGATGPCVGGEREVPGEVGEAQPHSGTS